MALEIAALHPPGSWLMKHSPTRAPKLTSLPPIVRRTTSVWDATASSCGASFRVQVKKKVVSTRSKRLVAEMSYLSSGCWGTAEAESVQRGPGGGLVAPAVACHRQRVDPGVHRLLAGDITRRGSAAGSISQGDVHTCGAERTGVVLRPTCSAPVAPLGSVVRPRAVSRGVRVPEHYDVDAVAPGSGV